MVMDYSDNIKRPRMDENDNNSHKKSKDFYLNSHRLSGDSVLLKQLFPPLITGLIIGKGGEAITKLQSETNTTIKMSKNGDFFPGTTDRVCVIVGRIEDAKEAHMIIWEKIKKKQEIGNSDDGKSHDYTQFRVVVPNVTVGMIIGKGGCFVKQIKDETGATVQVSPKSQNQLLLERIVTISGSSEQAMKAFDMVFSKICDDPQSGSCPNISYTEIGAASLAGSDLGLLNSSGLMGLSGGAGMGGSISMPSAFASFNFAEVMRKMNPVHVDNLRTTLRASGCSNQGVEEITASLLILANYNLLSNLTATQPGTVSLEYLANVLNGMSPAAAAAASASSASNVNYGSLAGMKHDTETKDSQHLFNLYTGFSNSNSSANGIDLLTDLADGGKELQINESLIGAILGPAGRNLVDIQKFTSTTVHISKKGVFAPGTKNRLVTIRGNNPSDIEKAVFMIQQYVLQEEAKRTRQDPHLSLSKY